MSVSLEQFAKSLNSSGLMTAEEIKAFHAGLPPEKRKDVTQFATELVRKGKLTKYQASAIYQGNTANLALGDYRVLDKIGAGGMGQVFKAEHRRMKRIVALKLLPPEVTKDAQAVKRFQREVETAASLIHPNIVTAYDAGEHKGVYYLIMEFVDGQDLSSLVKKQGTLPLETALNFIAQAARGLEHAHEKGVVHRDIKPANLLVDKKGTVKILDMGLARVESDLSSREVEEAEGLTNSGVMMGTIDYMSPEQAVDTHQADHRADIYSLGCTLFYLLAGRRMYEGQTLMRRVLAHRDAPIPSLAALRPDVPPMVDEVLQRMVAKRPEDRYASMAEAGQALEKCLAGIGSSGESSILHVDNAVDEDLASFLKGMQAQSGTGVATAMRVSTDTLVNRQEQDTRPDSVKRPAVTAAKSRQRMILGGVGVGVALASALAVIVWMNRSKPATVDETQVAQANASGSASAADDGAGKDTTEMPPAKHGSMNLPAFPKFGDPQPEKPAETPEPTPAEPVVPATPSPPTVTPVAPQVASPPKTIIVGSGPGEVGDLYGALTQARAGDTILVRHRGPLELPPLDMTAKSPLTIIGDAQDGVDFWPLIVQGPPPLEPGTDANAPTAAAPAQFYGEQMQLTLKKLHLAIGGLGPRKGKLGAVFAIGKGSIRIEQCSITAGSLNQPGDAPGDTLPLVQTTAGPGSVVEVVLRQSYVRGARLAGCVAAIGAGQVTLDAQQLLWAGGTTPFVTAQDVTGLFSLSLSHCTVYNAPSLVRWESSPSQPENGAVLKLAMSRSLLVGPSNKDPLLAWKLGDAQADLAKAVADGVVSWQGEANVFHHFDGYYRERGAKVSASINKWRTLWGQSGAAVDREADPHFRVWPTDYLLQEANTWDYEPRFWRNKEKAKQISEEMGAAVASLPAALPRSTDRPSAPPDLAARPRGNPRVLRVHQRDGPYKTIEAAMAEVRDNDIIEIADNGPYTPKRNFTINPGDGVLASPVDCLTLRAAKDANPLLLVRDDAQEGPAATQTLFGGWFVFLGAQNRTSLQIDGLHFRLIESPQQIQRMVIGAMNMGLVRTSNCSFNIPLPAHAQYISNLPAVLWLENSAYINPAARHDLDMVRLDSTPYNAGGGMLWSVRNCLFNANALAHRSGNPVNRKKINLSLQGNTFLGRVAELVNGPTLVTNCSENLVKSADAVFKVDDDSIWRNTTKKGERNLLWIGERVLTEQERNEFGNSLLPGPVAKTWPAPEGVSNARDVLRPFRVRRTTVTAADGSPVGVRFDYLPEVPAG